MDLGILVLLLGLELPTVALHMPIVVTEKTAGSPLRVTIRLGHFEHLYPLVTGSRPWVGEGEVVGGIRELVARHWRMNQSVERCEWQIKMKLVLGSCTHRDRYRRSRSHKKNNFISSNMVGSARNNN